MNNNINIKSVYDKENNGVDVKSLPMNRGNGGDYRAVKNKMQVLYLKAAIFISMNLIAILLVVVVIYFNIDWYLPFLVFLISSCFAYNMFFRSQ